MIGGIRVVRSARRTLALHIGRDGSVTVRAPLRTSDAAVRRMIDEHAEWIRAKTAEMRAKLAERPPRTYAAGERFPFRGRSHRLHVVPGAGTALRFEEERGFVLAERLLPRAKDLFEAWYRREAKRACIERAAACAERMGLRHSKVAVREARTRWGSCGPDGSLSFNWKLVMAPPEVLEYVVIHEIAHLQHRNHSKRFWNLVATHCPWWRQARLWLNRHGHTLSL